MKRYRVKRIVTTKVLFRLLERRKVNGKWCYVCVAICSGRFNAGKIERKLNR